VQVFEPAQIALQELTRTSETEEGFFGTERVANLEDKWPLISPAHTREVAHFIEKKCGMLEVI
jgi:hypothetical protein